MFAHVFHQIVNSTVTGASLVIKNTFISVERSERSHRSVRAKSAPAALRYSECRTTQVQSQDLSSGKLELLNQHKNGRRLRSSTMSGCAATAAAAASVLSPAAPWTSNEFGFEETGRNTTVIVRNLPHDYSRAQLIDTLAACGNLNSIDFLYLPMNFGTLTSFGHAFLNFTSHKGARRFMQQFEGFYDWIQPCMAGRAPAHVEWSVERQGLHGQIERYRNSAMMHKNVVDEAKPILLRHGVRIPFPEPTQVVKPLRVRAWKMRKARCIDSETPSTDASEGSSPVNFRLGDDSFENCSLGIS